MSADIQPKLSVVALAWNEARHLRPCFRSLEALTSRPDVETLILLDAAADEATALAARDVSRRVEVARFVNFSAQRNRALDLARGKWVFFIDPDERCTPSLAREIASCMDSDDCAAYRVPRRNILFGHEVKHTGWWPDYQVRLLKRAKVRYDESREVHEFPVVDGATGTLRAPLVHYNYETWGQFFKKQQEYAALEARALNSSGRRAHLRSVVGQPLREFKRRFIDYQGYKDGLLGLALSLAMSAYAGQTYLRLWQLQRRRVVTG